MDAEERDMFDALSRDVKTIADETVRFMSSHEVRVGELEKDVENILPEVRANTRFRNGTMAIVAFVVGVGAVVAWAPKVLGLLLTAFMGVLD